MELRRNAVKCLSPGDMFYVIEKSEKGAGKHAVTSLLKFVALIKFKKRNFNDYKTEHAADESTMHTYFGDLSDDDTIYGLRFTVVQRFPYGDKFVPTKTGTVTWYLFNDADIIQSKKNAKAAQPDLKGLFLNKQASRTGGCTNKLFKVTMTITNSNDK
eukprot:4608118-Karenia_brevis.AAC.1